MLPDRLMVGWVWWTHPHIHIHVLASSELVKFKLERCQELRSVRGVAADSEDK